LNKLNDIQLYRTAYLVHSNNLKQLIRLRGRWRRADLCAPTETNEMTYTRYDELGSAGQLIQPPGLTQHFRLVLEPISAFFERWTNRRAIHRLSQLEDRNLHDIGITRSDVEWALSLPGHIDPSYALQERVEHRRKA
jgi:uncharacterized protein YjiS (DUF1127 family)